MSAPSVLPEPTRPEPTRPDRRSDSRPPGRPEGRLAPGGSGSGRITGRRLGLLLVFCGAIFLEGIDVAMLNVALPAVRADLGMSTGSLSWVVTAYVLGYGGFMLLGGRAADLLGRRRMFLFWLTVFVLFSGLGGLADAGWTLIAARFVTGVSAAFMTPAGLAVITTGFAEGAQRNRALLVYAGTAAAGFSLGLVTGGLLTGLSWRWVFFAPVLLAGAILPAAALLIPREERPARAGGGRFDLAGAVTSTAAALLLVLAVVRVGQPDAKAGVTVAAAVAGLALLAVFVLVERRSAEPLVRLGLLRSGPLVRANTGAMLFAGSFFGFQFVVTLYLQELRGWSPLQTGLALLAVGVDAVLAPTLTPRLVERFGTARVVLGGFCLAAVGYALFLPVGPDWTYPMMFPTMILTGLAFALSYGPLTIAATEGVAQEEQGLAGGLLNTSFQFGAALGLSIVVAVNAGAAAGGAAGAGAGGAGTDGLRAALVVPVAAVALGAVVTGFGLRRETRRRRPGGPSRAA